MKTFGVRTFRVPRNWLAPVVGAALVAGCSEDTVTEPTAVASVAVTPETSTLVSIGATVFLAASALDQGGNVIQGKTFNWSSADNGVATVATTGVVTATGNGSTTITASVDGRSGTAGVLVEQAMAALDFPIRISQKS